MTTLISSSGYTGSTSGLMTPADYTYFPESGQGLIALYEFKEGTGTAINDTSGNGNNGTLTPGAGAWTAEGTGYSYLFDGLASVIDTPALAAAGFTIAAVIKADTTQTATFGAVCSNMKLASAGAALSFQKSNAPGIIYGQSGGSIALAGIADSIAAAYRLLIITMPPAASGTAVITDMTSGASATAAISATYVPAPTNTFSIGGNPTHATIGSMNWFKGNIAALAIYNTVLSNARTTTNPTGLSQFAKIQSFMNSSILAGRSITV